MQRLSQWRRDVAITDESCSRSYNAAVQTTFSFLLCFVLTLPLAAQMKTGVDVQGVYHSAEFGFSFKPPTGLTDVTKRAASGNDDPNAVKLLLFELSGPNGQDLNWRGLAVQSYPRDKVATKDDAEAEAKLSRTIIGKDAIATAAPQVMAIEGRNYVLTQFERSRGMLTEHSKVYATIIHGELVAFAFTANTATNLDGMAESLKTLTVKQSSGK
jgi:hypothetical protein